MDLTSSLLYNYYRTDPHFAFEASGAPLLRLLCSLNIIFILSCSFSIMADCYNSNGAILHTVCAML